MHNPSSLQPLRLLIVEDNISLAENIYEYLGEERYHLDHAADGLTALHLLATQSYDVVVLDVMLPGVDGFTLCRRVREDLRSQVPIILLTAKDSLDDKITGFGCGADDYLIKPFHLRELEMRIQSLSRRGQVRSPQLSVGKLHYNPQTLKASYTDKGEVLLSGYNATILETLMRKHPAYTDYSTLSEALWGNSDGSANTIRTHVYTLRKLLKEAFGLDFILTLHGRGYSLLELKE